MKMRKTAHIFIAGLAMLKMGCGSGGTTDNTESLPVVSNQQTQSSETTSISSQKNEEQSETEMVLRINDIVVPVIWSENTVVKELEEQTAQDDITVQLSRYSDFEQVGSLGKSYTAQNEQITAENGDIVLYNSSNIVLFYGSNSWSYTKLGHMNLPEKEIKELLDHDKVTINLSLQN